MVREHRTFQPEPPVSAKLREGRAALVTLTNDAELRGCMGELSIAKPLYLAVRDAALLAATRDPRIHPVLESELSQLRYEISVLSVYRHVLHPESIRVGRDGLLIRQKDAQAIMLPQVAVEQRWDRATFLAQTAQKAGLRPDAWRSPGIDIFAFTALVFSDASGAVTQSLSHR